MPHAPTPTASSPPPIVVYATPLPKRPFWVKLGLWGLPGRRWAWAFFWGCTAFAALSLVLGFAAHPAWFVGAAMVLASAWYRGAIWWVDRYGQW